MQFPTEEQVLAHGFWFRPIWWTPRVLTGRGDFLEQLPARERGYHAITRADLLATPTLHGLPQALLAGYVWGTGGSGFLWGGGPGCSATTTHSGWSTLSRPSLRACAPVTQPGRMPRWGRSNYLKYLGPSFFTKFLYAADARSDGCAGRALIEIVQAITHTRWTLVGGLMVQLHAAYAGVQITRTTRVEDCLLREWNCRFFTEERAVDHFRRIVPLVERGIRPWDDKAVVAAGFAPLVLRAWLSLESYRSVRRGLHLFGAVNEDGVDDVDDEVDLFVKVLFAD